MLSSMVYAMQVDVLFGVLAKFGFLLDFCQNALDECIGFGALFLDGGFIFFIKVGELSNVLQEFL